MITSSKPKMHRVLQDNGTARVHVNKYHISIKDEIHNACRECFQRTFGETTGFIERAAQKKSESATGIIPSDRRGKTAPPIKRSEEDLQGVKNHISSFTSYESHYCR